MKRDPPVFFSRPYFREMPDAPKRSRKIRCACSASLLRMSAKSAAAGDITFRAGSIKTNSEKERRIFQRSHIELAAVEVRRHHQERKNCNPIARCDKLQRAHHGIQLQPLRNSDAIGGEVSFDIAAARILQARQHDFQRTGLGQSHAGSGHDGCASSSRGPASPDRARAGDAICRPRPQKQAPPQSPGRL